MEKPKQLILDSFIYRAFDKTKTKNYIDMPMDEFTTKLNSLYTSTSQLKPGYAPFCKHIFIENFITGFKPRYLPINETTEKLIKTCYDSRQANELPVLTRYIPIESIDYAKIPDAKYIDIILYSKEQIVNEKIAMKESKEEIEKVKAIDFDYGVIGIKPQDVDYELPMLPITMMRNAVGIDQGGSGVKLENEKYMESVRFWEKNIIIQ